VLATLFALEFSLLLANMPPLSEKGERVWRVMVSTGQSDIVASRCWLTKEKHTLLESAKKCFDPLCGIVCI